MKTQTGYPEKQWIPDTWELSCYLHPNPTQNGHDLAQNGHNFPSPPSGVESQE